MKISGIYKIQSISHPERCYIGSAVNIIKRWDYHRNHLKHNTHHSGKLQNHFNKYSIEDLQFSILLECSKEDLIKNEQKFLDGLNPYFNICRIAGNCLGIKASAETKEKLSKQRKGKNTWSKGKNLSEEHKQKISQSLIGNQRVKGYKHSEETCRKKGKSLIGNQRAKGKHHKMSLEFCQNQSNRMLGNKRGLGNKSRLGQHPSEETRQKMKESHTGKIRGPYKKQII